LATYGWSGISLSTAINEHERQEKHDDAENIYKQAIQGRLKTLGPDHDSTMHTMANLAGEYQKQNKLDQAAELYADVLEVRRRKLGTEHSTTLTTINDLAAVYQKQGKTEQAVELYREVLDASRRALGRGHPDTLASTNKLAWAFATSPDAKLRDPARALELAAEVAETSPKTASYRGTLGTARYRTGDWQGAIADLEKTINLRKSDDSTNANEGFFLAMAAQREGPGPRLIRQGPAVDGEGELEQHRAEALPR
jgi:tetratricopeptide (TPR) repeat protein